MNPALLPAAITRSRPRHYGPEVQEALVVAWRAANDICSKRLIPFLPELIPVLERHGHLVVTSEVRVQLLALSCATADRILQPFRQRDGIRGISTTKPGALLKRQIPIRTFADWDDARPGFLEADLVAHCGYSTEGAFLHTLTLAGVATGWVECLPLLHRTQHAVKEALRHASQLLPFSILGLDTDNGDEFINDLLLAYCEQHGITFTRGRVAKKNDQCFVEQKNGSVVRHVVGYDRFEGEPASPRGYPQLAELYRALRLYVNVFQPSMKLRQKSRDGSRVQRIYDQAATPLQRLFAANVLTASQRERLETIYQALDPVLLLRHIEVLLGTRLRVSLWWHAVVRPVATEPEGVAEPKTDAVRFDVAACGLADGDAPEEEQGRDEQDRGRRKYHWTVTASQPRWWRTRPDPFADVWGEVEGWLRTAPERRRETATWRILPGLLRIRSAVMAGCGWMRRGEVEFSRRQLEAQSGPDQIGIGQDVTVELRRSTVRLEERPPPLLVAQKSSGDALQGISLFYEVVVLTVGFAHYLTRKWDSENPAGLDDAGGGESLAACHLSTHVGRYQTRELIAGSVEALRNRPQGVAGLHGVRIVLGPLTVASGRV